MASPHTVKVLGTTRVTPASDSPISATEFSLPLTFFDTLWFKFHPVERIFFYQLNVSNPEYFHSIILPKLKRSLSLTLLHYLPLAGNLRWPSNSPKPIVTYSPNDGVLVKVAESNSNFSLLSGNEIHKALELHSLVPQLMMTDNIAPIIALQITLFPSQGFCVGITAHHAILDGRSTTMFVKSWAYLCKQGNTENSSLPPELTPFYDRSVIKDPSGLDLLYLKQWLAFTSSDSDPNRRSLIIEQNIRDVPDDLVRATFDLSREHIKSLREKVLSKLDKAKPLHLSSFVLTFAYVSTCLIKARGGESDRTVNFGFAADARSRLNPPIPENYFGNCVLGPLASAKAGNFMDENGFATAAELASDMVKELEMNGILEQAEKKLTQFFDVIMETGKQVISVSGSPRFGVYGADFGWGKPRKVVIVSIDRGGAISLAESRDGSALIEIGLALNKHEMKTFASLFLDGLRDL
ncbi:PREDICTED: phenolic glucoside malonyltransferase 1 [Theobroma cacao]|uniref:Phenolic glucoside malonyltransferase 1 n=1 Tax=Theobroma cacao TaxID=3641 RepID=A0AB32WCZ3_THECC|nr:PREDICTED: phenolic glucoside malonyltransferase 1 [Theobroma cacao]